MGVCTQFDVLWDNLTGREHLLLFGAIKGLSKVQAGRQADARLDQVSMYQMPCKSITVNSAIELQHFSLTAALSSTDDDDAFQQNAQ